MLYLEGCVNASTGPGAASFNFRAEVGGVLVVIRLEIEVETIGTIFFIIDDDEDSSELVVLVTAGAGSGSFTFCADSR